MLVLLSGTFCSAQGETWNWCFGDSAGIKFINGKNPIAVNSFKGWSYEGTSVLSDSKGKVILYSYGNYLFDSNNILQNKSYVLKGGNSSCQPIQLIRHRKSQNVHIFTTSPMSGVFTDGFNHIVYNNGLRLPYQKIFNDIGEKQTSIFHQNNNDIWVTTHGLPNDTFYSFLVTKNELIECPIINKIGASYKDRYPTQGVLKYSPSGKYCANANWDLNRLELYRFNKENSKFYDLVTIIQYSPYAVEFSPDENYLYFNDRGTHIYQVCLKKWNKDSIEKSKKVIATAPTEILSQLQLGPDKKIYIALYGQYFIGRIENPNNADTFCRYKFNFLDLSGRVSEGGLPNFNASYFFSPSIDYSYEQNCRTNTITFEGKDTFDATNHKWIFNKGNILATMTSKNPSYTFSDTGKWHVQYIASNGIRSDTAMKTITIRPKLEAGFLGNDINFCEINPFPIILHSPKNLHCIHWYNDTMNELARVDSLTLSKEGTYYAKATNLSFCIEWDTIKISKTSPAKNLKITKGTITLSSNEDHLRYIWFRNNLRISDTTKTIPLTKNGTYKLYAFTKYGCWVYSDEIIITNVGIKYLELDNFISVYPNPGKGKISIDINKAGMYRVKLYSIDGKLLFEKVVKAFETETLSHKLPKGEYFLIIFDNEGNSFNRKILVE